MNTIELTVIRIRCSKHKIDKELTFDATTPKGLPKPGLRISSYMKALGCEDYKTSTRTITSPA